MKKIILLLMMVSLSFTGFTDTIQTPDTITTGDKIENVITDVTTILPIKIDTVNSVDEIVTDGIYLVKIAPLKGSHWTTYVLYIFGILGLVFGGFLFFKKKAK